MSSTSGWIEFEGRTIDFPYIPSHLGVWNVAISNWCQIRDIHFENVDPFWVKATVTRAQIYDFLSFVYGVSSGSSGRPDDVSLRVSNEKHRELELLRANIASCPKDGSFTLAGFDY